jgi:hypothetical protein
LNKNQSPKVLLKERYFLVVHPKFETAFVSFTFTQDLKEKQALGSKKYTHFGYGICVAVKLLSIIRNQDLSQVVNYSDVIRS